MKNGGFISGMNLWMSCFIKRRSLVFRALLNPPVATLRLVKCDYFFFFFFQVEILRWKRHWNIFTAPSAGLQLIWGLFGFIDFSARESFTCLSCLIVWSEAPLLKRTYSFFFFFISFKRKKKKKFNLDSANTLVTSKAVKRKKEQIIRRWWELAHSPVEGKRGTE